MFRRNNATGNTLASFSRFPQSASQQPWPLSHILVRMDIANETADDRGWRKKNGLYPMVRPAREKEGVCMQQPCTGAHARALSLLQYSPEHLPCT